jgi:hypothetical protein
MSASDSPSSIEVVVIWGPPGSGKTRRVLDDKTLTTGGLFMALPGDTWKEYNGEKTVFFDGFCDSSCPISLLRSFLESGATLTVSDQPSKRAEWTRVVICSNINPLTWYPNA